MTVIKSEDRWQWVRFFRLVCMENRKLSFSSLSENWMTDNAYSFRTKKTRPWWERQPTCSAKSAAGPSLNYPQKREPSWPYTLTHPRSSINGGTPSLLVLTIQSKNDWQCIQLQHARPNRPLSGANAPPPPPPAEIRFKCTLNSAAVPSPNPSQKKNKEKERLQYIPRNAYSPTGKALLKKFLHKSIDFAFWHINRENVRCRGRQQSRPTKAVARSHWSREWRWENGTLHGCVWWSERAARKKPS